MPPTRSLHARAIRFILIGAFGWSSGGYLVRQLSIVGAREIVFWRSLFMTLFVAGVLTVIHRRRTAAAVRSAGVPGLLAARFSPEPFFSTSAR